MDTFWILWEIKLDTWSDVHLAAVRATHSEDKVYPSKMLKKTVKLHQRLLSTLPLSKIVHKSYGGDNQWVNEGLTVT